MASDAVFHLFEASLKGCDRRWLVHRRAQLLAADIIDGQRRAVSLGVRLPLAFGIAIALFLQVSDLPLQVLIKPTDDRCLSRVVVN